MHVIAWLVSVAVCIALLIITPRYRIGLVIKLAVGAIIGGIVLVTLTGLALRGLGLHPSHGFSTALFQLLFTVIITAMLNVANLVFHGMIDAQGAFHTRYNAANLQRFPISFVIRNAPKLKIFGTAVWCAGSALMLYGVWFDMQV